MTTTRIGVERRTVRTAGTVAVVAVLATAMVIESMLQSQGLGWVALVVYALAVPVLLWSIIEDVRRIRN